DLIAPEVAGRTLTSLLPEVPRADIRLASAGAEAETYRVTAVNGQAVADCGQLHAAVTAAAQGGKKSTVTLAGPGGGGKAGIRVSAEPAQLLALSQATAGGAPLLRVTEGGNPWTVLRQDGMRCKATARVEPRRGLLQVVLG